MRRNRRVQFIYCFIVLTLIIANLFTLNVNAETKIKRLAGKGRYETAKEVSSDGWTSSEYAVLVTGADYPDALSATPLAKKYEAPILLTEKNKLNDNTLSEIKRLGVRKIFIVGGTGVVGTEVENEIKNLDIEIERIFGKGRYETSVAVAKEVGVEKGIFVAYGLNYADALSVGPIAAKLQMPILLNPTHSLDPSLEELMSYNFIAKTYVVGGTSLISDNVLNKFPNAERLYGSDRYETNKILLDKFKDQLDFSNLFIATGTNFPDALSGGALASKNGNPMVLISNAPNNATLSIKKHNTQANLIVLGGEGVVSTAAVQKFKSGVKMFNLNAGHALSGADTGASGINGLKEEVLTRQLVKELDSEFKSKGQQTNLVVVDHATTLDESLNKQIILCNSVNADMNIVIHFNSHLGIGYGTEIFTYQGKYVPEADRVLKNMSKLGFRNRGIKNAELALINGTDAETIYIEVCFIDNVKDVAIMNEYGLNAIAKAIVCGVLDIEFNEGNLVK
nr:cell wall-binding repeat-containing protein [Clostridium sp. UBA6640]